MEFNTPDTVAEFRDMFAEGKVNLVDISFSTNFPNLFSIRNSLSSLRSSKQLVIRIPPSSTMDR